MRRFLLACLGALCLSAAAQTPWTSESTAPAPFSSPYTRAELLAHAPEGVQPGRPLWLGVRLSHAPDWHSYWRNPGDSGLPTELQWTLSPGVQAGEIAWPTPRKFPLGDLANYGYAGSVLLTVPLTVSQDFKGPALDIAVQASWLVCRKECLPESARFAWRLPAQRATLSDAAAFEAAWAAQPRTLQAGTSQLTPHQDTLELNLEALPAAWRGQPLEVFVQTPGLIQPGLAWQQSWQGPRWTAQLPMAPERSERPATVPLVLALATPTAATAKGVGTLPAGVALDLPVTAPWPTARAPAPAEDLPPALSAALAAAQTQVQTGASPPAASGGAAIGLGAALLGALLGGLILNLMPCVFPVLALKVLSFAGPGGADRRSLRLGAWAYTAGVVLSFVALGAALLALRAAGEQLGWGFQLQNPAVVAALAALFTLIGLNLAGLFHMGHVLPSRWLNLQSRHLTVDAFLTGVLATAVAAPCTAPFMGAALGLAVTLPTPSALAVFVALGLGMALPYLAASWLSAVQRLLPRPGAWMESLRQLLAFPMFATVLWLLWVLGQQSGLGAVLLLLWLLLGLAALAWALGRGGRWRRWLAPLLLLGLAWGLLTGRPVLTQPLAAAPAASTLATATHSSNAPLWQPWSAALEAELLAAGRPVFVDFTAAWCVTCQYNKFNALAQPEVLQAARDKQVALLRADWTTRDPAITAALAQLGRSGVPAYLLRAPGRPDQVLSEVLSGADLLAALAAL